MLTGHKRHWGGIREPLKRDRDNTEIKGALECINVSSEALRLIDIRGALREIRESGESSGALERHNRV